ncbi:MAG: Gfo/Idh/MocA family protein [Pikeienuella sp.]|uniref:Gfo/Idh/MocA family protein n=1 Tax=Pikeienuella sp. TaxID=2831957 RepID=UPI003918F995
MPDFEPLRLGLIGCGGMGLRHALAVADMHAAGRRPVEIVAICDTDEGKRARVAALLSERTGRQPAQHVSTGTLLDDRRVEAVDVVLPTSLHHATVLDALSAGMHVLVEKPLALTVSACDLIVAAAARAGKVVASSENYRRLPGNRALAALIADGALGPLDAMFVRNFAPPEPPVKRGEAPVESPGWYRARTHAGGYHAMEMGAHEADLQEFWFGAVASVSAEMRTFGHSVSPDVTEDLLTATFRFESGFVSNIAFASTMRGFEIADRLLIGQAAVLSSAAWHEWQNGAVARADGTRQSSDDLVAAWLGSLAPDTRQRLLPEGVWTRGRDGSVATEPLSYGVGVAIHDFARAVRTGTAPEIPADRARRAVALCCAMMEAAHAGAPVRMEQILSGEIRAAQAALNQAIGLPA